MLEFASVITLMILWLLLWWQQQLPAETAVAMPPLSREQLYDLSPAEFEAYVGQVFRHRGYRVQLRGRSGDLGVDLMITNRMGKRAIVQCKRYRRTVGPEIVRELFGTMIHERVAHAFLVTTSDISDSACEWAQGKPMTLINGEELVRIATILSVPPHENGTVT